MNAYQEVALATTTDVPANIKVVNRHLQFPKATLVPPNSTGYVHLAAEIDLIWPFGLRPASSAKRMAVAHSLGIAARLERMESVIKAKVFVARFIPPGQGKRMETRKHVHVARFDLVVLIETTNPLAAANLQSHPDYQELVSVLREKSRYLHVVRAHNERKMGDVDMNRDGVFLFNFFHGDDPSKLIPVWYYSAGWFQAKTNLHNSILLMPDENQKSEYGIINFCRWDHWYDILPDLRFRPTFHSYVLANFDANGIVPMPILYGLAR
jgi:hypothetical protein